MGRESVSADSKGLMGALSPLLCISFDLHKNGASLGSAEGEFGTTGEHGFTRMGSDRDQRDTGEPCISSCSSAYTP